jgi:hypothetical protein
VPHSIALLKKSSRRPAVKVFGPRWTGRAAALRAYFGFVQSEQVSYDLSVTATEQDILRTLIELDGLVKAMATANPKPDLKPLFARLDGLTRQLPPQTAPDLLHYLHRKSYGKARFFLEGRDAENTAGSCGHQ